MSDEQLMYLTIKQYPATADGRYSAIEGFVIAYHGSIFCSYSFDELDSDRDYSEEHGVTLRVYINGGIKCVRLCRIVDDEYVALGDGFVFAWIYESGESRDPTGLLTENEIEEYLLNRSRKAGDAMNRKEAKSRWVRTPGEPREGKKKTAERESKEIKLPKAVEILFEKLGAGETVAQKAILSLGTQAKRRGEKLDKAVPLLVPYLQNKQFLLRAGAAETLGYIGTQKAVAAIVQAFEAASERELSRWVPRTDEEMFCMDQLLAKWFATSLAKRQTVISAMAMVELLTSSSLPDFAKAAVMSELSEFDLDDLDISIPESVTEVVEKFASFDDEEISTSAIKLLGKF
jgi:hypothetical protein